jgi:transcriptional regulator with XRE-family HTH domain
MDYEKFQEMIVKKIRQIRESKNMTQEDMEEGEYGINVRTYQRIETRATDITMKNLFKISKKLNVDIRKFFEKK